MILTTLVASLPSPSTGELSIGPLHLRAYGLMIALGVIAAIWLLGRQLERKRIGTPDDASSIGIWGVAAGIIGARLYHVATDWDRFSDNLTAIPKIWEGGLGIPGGLLLGILAGAWQSKRRGIPPAMLLTCAAPAIPLAQAIGRWGNWFNQELYGRPTDLPWGLEIDDPQGYPPGTTFGPPAGPLQPREASNPPSAYYLGVAISDAKYAQAQAMLAAVLAQGFKIDLGDRATVEPRWAQFVADNGYVMP